MHVPASLRVGAVMAAGLLIAASTLVSPTAVGAPANIAGMIVFLDPGHNGGNDASISRQLETDVTSARTTRDRTRPPPGSYRRWQS